MCHRRCDLNFYSYSKISLFGHSSYQIILIIVPFACGIYVKSSARVKVVCENVKQTTSLYLRAVKHLPHHHCSCRVCDNDFLSRQAD